MRDYPSFKASEITEKQRDVIIPYIDARKTAFTLGAVKGFSFRADKPKGSVMVCHGFTESGFKYREMIYYFLSEGFNVVVPDLRGHGLSREEATRATHIDSFDTYVRDFADVIYNVLSALEKPYILYAHSMGGLIGARILETRSDVFSCAVLSSPLFRLNLGKVPEELAKDIASFMCLMGLSKALLPGQHAYNPKPDFKNSSSTCPERYMIYKQLQNETKCLQSGGASAGWMKAALSMCRTALDEKELEKVSCPVMILRAEQDAYVLPSGQEEFIRGINRGQLVRMPGTKHEIYMSGDSVMPEYLGRILDFIEGNING